MTRTFAAFLMMGALAVCALAPAPARATSKPSAAPSIAASAQAGTAPATPGKAAAPSPAASPEPPRAAPVRAPFVYLRDRYRRDDQGAALQHPITQLAGLNYMLGTWSCHIYTLTAKHKITHDFGHTTYVFARTMNDRWLLGTDAKNTEFLYFTYDPAAEHWVYDDVKGFPSYGLSYATGSAHHLAFDSVVESALGDERRLRTTLRYVDPKHFTLLDEEETPDDLFTPVVEFDFARH